MKIINFKICLLFILFSSFNPNLVNAKDCTFKLSDLDKQSLTMEELAQKLSGANLSFKKDFVFGTFEELLLDSQATDGCKIKIPRDALQTSNKLRIARGNKYYIKSNSNSKNLDRFSISFSSNQKSRGVAVAVELFCPETFSPIDVVEELQKHVNFNVDCNLLNRQKTNLDKSQQTNDETPSSAGHKKMDLNRQPASSEKK